MQVMIFGGNGFIGRHLVAELARRGHTLHLPVRNRERAKDSLILLPNTNVYAYSPSAAAGMKKSFAGADVIINLVGILNESGNSLYERAHGEFVRMMIDSCVKNQVPRVIHISALGAFSGAPSAYLRSKAKGEQIIENNDLVSHVIIRPSVVFGSGDKFVNRFANLIQYFPVIPLPGAQAKFQPIYVGDLVTMIADVLEDDSYHNKTLHAGGDAVLTLEEIFQHIARALNKNPRVLPLGEKSSYLFASIAEKIPFAEIITRDNCLSMQVPSVCPSGVSGSNDAAQIIGKLTDLETGLAAMFAADDGYAAMRHRAGRG